MPMFFCVFEFIKRDIYDFCDVATVFSNSVLHAVGCLWVSHCADAVTDVLYV